MLPKIDHPRCDSNFRDSILTSKYWIAERKYDGSRAFLKFENGKVQTIMRSGIDRTVSFTVPYQSILEGTIIDGEIYSPNGFADTMSGVLGSGNPNLLFAAFDIPFCKRIDLRKDPLKLRQDILRNMIEDLPKVHIVEQSENKNEFYQYELSANREGVVLKKIDCGYGIEWVKMKGFRDTSVILLSKDPREDHGELSYPTGMYIGNTIIQASNIKVPQSMLSKIKPGRSVIDIKALSFDPKSLAFRHPFITKVRPDVLPFVCTIDKICSDFNVEV